MVDLINSSGVVYAVMDGLTGLTGSLFLSCLLVLILLFVIAFAFRLPIEFAGIFLFPFLLTLWAYDATFTAVGGVMAIYLGIVLAKNILIK